MQFQMQPQVMIRDKKNRINGIEWASDVVNKFAHALEYISKLDMDYEGGKQNNEETCPTSIEGGKMILTQLLSFRPESVDKTNVNAKEVYYYYMLSMIMMSKIYFFVDLIHEIVVIGFFCAENRPIISTHSLEDFKKFSLFDFHLTMNALRDEVKRLDDHKEIPEDNYYQTYFDDGMNLLKSTKCQKK